MRRFGFAILTAVAAGLLGLHSHAKADLVVVPTSAASTEGNNNSVVPFNTGARTNQYQITNAALGGLQIGSVITGVQFRMDGGLAGSPSSSITWTDFEITLAQAANAIGSMSSTLASNMTNPMQVMDGSFTLSAASLPGTGTPRDFGATVPFDTGYTYTGGDLVILLTHNNASSGTTPTVDGIQTDTAGTGGIRALSTPVGFQMPTADNMAFRMPVMRLVYTAVPEAGAWLMVGAVTLGACAVQRFRAFAGTR